MNLPSVKTLGKLYDCYAKKAKLLRKVLEQSSRDVLDDMIEDMPQFAKTRAWRRSCYNRPWLNHMKLEMANELLEGFGVEHAGEVDFRDGPPLEYVNMGDTYNLTLCLFQGRWVVIDVGTIIERHERLFRER